MQKHPGREARKDVEMMAQSETDQTATEIPIACTLTAEEQATWRDGIGQTILHGYREVRELPDGYALRFPGDAPSAQILLDFVIHERACCPFFAFQLRFEPNQGAIWLHLSGGEGVKTFVKEMMGTMR